MPFFRQRQKRLRQNAEVAHFLSLLAPTRDEKRSVRLNYVSHVNIVQEKFISIRAEQILFEINLDRSGAVRDIHESGPAVLSLGYNPSGQPDLFLTDNIFVKLLFGF